MKTIIFFISCMIFTVIAVGQQPEATVKEVKVTAPKFTGIENAAAILNQKEPETISEYLVENFQHTGNQFFEGTEVVQFTVTPSGELTDFNIINSVSREIDREMIRVLRTTKGMWIPGYSNNLPVEMTKEVSMAFYPAEYSSKSVTEIFTQKATRYFNDGSKTLFEKHNPKKAMKFYSKGINYLPYEKSLLLLRGICRFETGDKEGAHKDWERLKTLGGFDIENINLTDNLKELKSYNLLAGMFKE
ncbi:MAG TPA: hypothetical protein VLA03_05495 [Draconibacterium sp.]|nr:hypothetical protein [Draconibacterium sp.]